MTAWPPSRDPSMAAPLMPKATAVWLVENTSLTFEQIADFCELHPLEVQAIADGEDYPFPATIDYPAILREIDATLARAGYGRRQPA